MSDSDWRAAAYYGAGAAVGTWPHIEWFGAALQGFVLFLVMAAVIAAHNWFTRRFNCERTIR
jgi:hypothetical protein